MAGDPEGKIIGDEVREVTGTTPYKNLQVTVKTLAVQWKAIETL